MLLLQLLFLPLLLIIFQVFINICDKKRNYACFSFNFKFLVLCAIIECCLNLFNLFVTGDEVNHKYHVPFGWIVGGLGFGLILIIFGIILCVCLRSSNCFSDSRSHEKDDERKVSHKFHILRNPSFFCGSGRYICGKHVDQKQTDGDSSNHTITVPKASSNLLIVFSSRILYL